MQESCYCMLDLEGYFVDLVFFQENKSCHNTDEKVITKENCKKPNVLSEVRQKQGKQLKELKQKEQMFQKNYE